MFPLVSLGLQVLLWQGDNKGIKMQHYRTLVISQ